VRDMQCASVLACVCLCVRGKTRQRQRCVCRRCAREVVRLTVFVRAFACPCFGTPPCSYAPAPSPLDPPDANSNAAAPATQMQGPVPLGARQQSVCVERKRHAVSLCACCVRLPVCAGEDASAVEVCLTVCVHACRHTHTHTHTHTPTHIPVYICTSLSFCVCVSMQIVY